MENISSEEYVQQIVNALFGASARGEKKKSIDSLSKEALDIIERQLSKLWLLQESVRSRRRLILAENERLTFVFHNQLKSNVFENCHDLLSNRRHSFHQLHGNYRELVMIQNHIRLCLRVQRCLYKIEHLQDSQSLAAQMNLLFDTLYAPDTS